MVHDPVERGRVVRDVSLPDRRAEGSDQRPTDHPDLKIVVRLAGVPGEQRGNQQGQPDRAATSRMALGDEAGSSITTSDQHRGCFRGDAGLSYGAVSGHAPAARTALTAAALVHLPATLTLLGIVIVAFAVVPRWAAGVAWTAFVVCLLMGQIGVCCWTCPGWS